MFIYTNYNNYQWRPNSTSAVWSWWALFGNSKSEFGARDLATHFEYVAMRECKNAMWGKRRVWLLLAGCLWSLWVSFLWLSSDTATFCSWQWMLEHANDTHTHTHTNTHTHTQQGKTPSIHVSQNRWAMKQPNDLGILINHHKAP